MMTWWQWLQWLVVLAMVVGMWCFGFPWFVRATEAWLRRRQHRALERTMALRVVELGDRFRAGNALVVEEWDAAEKLYRQLRSCPDPLTCEHLPPRLSVE